MANNLHLAIAVALLLFGDAVALSSFVVSEQYIAAGAGYYSGTVALVFLVNGVIVALAGFGLLLACMGKDGPKRR